MIAAIVLFFAFSTPVENTDVQKNNYAQLLPGELFEQIEKQSVAVTPVYVKNDVAQQTKKTSASAKTSSTPKLTADKAQTSRPIAVKEVKVAKQEAASTPVSVKPQAKVDHSKTVKKLPNSYWSLEKIKTTRMPGYWQNKIPYKKHETSSLSQMRELPLF